MARLIEVVKRFRLVGSDGEVVDPRNDKILCMGLGGGVDSGVTSLLQDEGVIG